MLVTEQSRRAVRSAKRFSCFFMLLFLVLLTLSLVDRFASAGLGELTGPVLRYLNLGHDNLAVQQLALMMFGGALMWGIGELVWRLNKQP